MKNKETNNASTVKEVNIVIPPDGGFAWVIVLAAFASNFTVDGIAFSFSIAILPDLAKQLNLPSSKIAIISSIQLGTYYLFGPIACACVNHYGFRAVGVIGSVVSFIGIFIASQISSFAGVIALYGFICGIGFGMIYTSTIISVGYYFEKFRALATGIAVCGSSVGGLCLSPLFASITANKGWNFTMLMQACLMIICLCSSLALRPLTTQKVPLTQDLFAETDQLATPSRVEFTELYKTNSMVSIDLDDPSEESRHFPQISIISSRFLPISEVERINKRERCCSYLKNLCSTTKSEGGEKLRNVLSTGPLDRKDIFYSASVVHLPEYKMTMPSESKLNEKTMLSYHISMILDPKTMKSATVLPNSTIQTFAVQEDVRCFGIPHMIHNALGKLFDISLLKSLVFCILALACFCFSVAWMTPYIFLPVRGEIAKIPESYTYWFISCISIGNTIGRITAGVLATIFPHLNACYMVGSATITGGILTIFSAFIGTNDASYQIGYCILFGFCIAFLSAMRPIVFVKVLGLDKLTNAFGLSAVVIGIGILSGTPIASALFGMSESFVTAFVLSGLLFILSGALIILAFFVYSWQEQRQTNRN